MIRVEETRDLATAFEIRRVVFTLGQNVPVEEEQDGLDEAALHFLAFDGDRPVGTARVVLGDGYGKIGRVGVLEEARGTGAGAALMRAVVARLRDLGLSEARLGAQTHALAFYERLGFEAHGPVFDDAGIPHRAMRMTLQPPL